MMSNSFPYVSSAGPLLSVIEKLRKHFPDEVTADTLKKWGLAPNNESYVLNVLRFLGFIDDDGKKQKETAKVFLSVEDDFKKGMEPIVKKAYEELFNSNGDHTWELNKGELTNFFRHADESSDTVGKRQAGTFLALAALAGHGEVPPHSSAGKSKTKKVKATEAKKSSKSPSTSRPAKSQRPPEIRKPEATGVGLTVRIELNLPATNDQKVYDGIFQSIKKHLLNE